MEQIFCVNVNEMYFDLLAWLYFLAQLTAVLLPVTPLCVIVVVGCSIGIVGIVDKLTCKLD